MALSGALAGVGGAVWVLMIASRWRAGIPAYGFDGITVSILAGNNPLGVVPAALLFGTLKSGGIAVQFSAGVPVQLIDVLRGLIVLFVAMPEFFRLIGRYVSRPERSASPATDGGKPVERQQVSTKAKPTANTGTNETKPTADRAVSKSDSDGRNDDGDARDDNGDSDGIAGDES
jgi:simple sugar transport system permease protein